MEILNEFESAVLTKLLEGDHPVLAALRAQVERARVKSREYSGAGFFCSFEVPSDVPHLALQEGFYFGDVDADMDGLEHGAGFVVYVRDGYLDFLEGYSYGEPWPKEVRKFSLFYHCKPRELQLPGVVSDRKKIY
jgi:hypothetical protein